MTIDAALVVEYQELPSKIKNCVDRLFEPRCDSYYAVWLTQEAYSADMKILQGHLSDIVGNVNCRVLIFVTW